MTTRYIVVQIIGDTLKLPIADLKNLEVPFGSTRFDGIREIVLNPYSANPRRFTEVSAGKRVCPNCGCVLHADETCCPDCNEEVRG